jgi:hypothetical protein
MYAGPFYDAPSALYIISEIGGNDFFYAYTLAGQTPETAIVTVVPLILAAVKANMEVPPPHLLHTQKKKKKKICLVQPLNTASHLELMLKIIITSYIFQAAIDMLAWLLYCYNGCMLIPTFINSAPMYDP